MIIEGPIVQPLAIARRFALLGAHGEATGPSPRRGPVDPHRLSTLIMTVDGVTMAFAGVALVVYMSTLTSLGYTATQYALLTSALVWSGKFLKGFSGVIVEQLHQGRALLDAARFLPALLCAAIGIPAILLSLLLARPAATSEATPPSRPA